MKRKYCFTALLPFILCVLLLPGCKELFHPGSGDDDNSNSNSGNNGQSNNTALSAPTGLNAYISDGYLYCSWNAINGADWYEIFVSETPNGSYEYLATAYGNSCSEYIDTDSAFSIYIKIRACSNEKESPLSAYFYLTPDVLTVTATAQSSESIHLSWNSIDRASYYVVERAQSEYGAYSTVLDSWTSTSWTDTGLSANTTYYYKVSAYNGSYSLIAESDPVSATTQQSAVTVLTVTVTETTSSSVSLSWNSVDGALYYVVERAQSEYGNYSTVSDYVSSTPWADAGLSANTTYYYKVFAYASYSTIAESDPVSATTQAVTQEQQAIPLVAFQWTSNTLSAGISQYYTFYAEAGTTYYIKWDDSKNGSSEYTCDIKVSASINGVTLFNEEDIGYFSPKPVTVASSGNVIIKVEGYYSYSSGSYAIMYY
jgi:hypothetical protein